MKAVDPTRGRIRDRTAATIFGSRIGGRLRFMVPSGTMNQMSLDLLLLEREIRRAALYIRSEGSAVSLHQSDPSQLAVTEVGPGSCWVDVVASRASDVADVLLSAPVQLLITLDWMRENIRPPRRSDNADERLLADVEPIHVEELAVVASRVANETPGASRVRVEATTSGSVVDIEMRRRRLWYR